MNAEKAERRRYVEGTLKSLAQMDLDTLRLAHFLCLVMVLSDAELKQFKELIDR
jgi:hypothetical protein